MREMSQVSFSTSKTGVQIEDTAEREYLFLNASNRI